MAASSISEPTLVLYKSDTCPHCQTLAGIWDRVKIALTAVYPKLRFFEVTSKDNSGKFNENIVPKNLIRYNRWFPMVLLVPGKVWDHAMANLGPRSTAEIKDGVQVLNGGWDGGFLKPHPPFKYNVQNPSDIAAWLKEALNHPEFKRVQGEPASAPASGIQPIAPLISNIVKSAPVISSSTPTTSNTSSIPHMSPYAVISDVRPDVCSMRIISRPR